MQNVSCNFKSTKIPCLLKNDQCILTMNPLKIPSILDLSQGISLNWISLLSDAHTNQGFHVMVNIEQRRQYCSIHPGMWSTFETTQNSPELFPPVTELALDFSSTLPSFDRVSSEVQPNPIIDSTELPPSYDEVTRAKTLYVHNI